MLTGRDDRKSFRARDKATLKGLTIDTKLAQESFNPKFKAVKGPTDGTPAMPASRENIKGFRGNPTMKELTVDIKRAQSPLKTENNGNTNGTRLIRNPTNVNSPRLSEAMMNRNWRNPRRFLEDRSSDMLEPLWSAPPEQLKFLDEIKAKSQREDDHDVINYDRGLQRVAYRCSRPEEVKPELVPFTKAENIDPDLCLSAPATKTEFSAAEVGTEERASKYNPSTFQPSIKAVVRLDQMAPAKRAGYEKILNWNEQHAADLKWDKCGGLWDASSITTVSLIEPYPGWEMIELPYAEIRAVNGTKKFERGLSGVEEILRSQLSTLVEPQSAGLPPAYLRKEYEEVLEERRRAIVLAKSACEPRGRRGYVSANKEVLARAGADDNQFNNLLGKLNRLCAPRLRAFTVNDKDDAYPPNHASQSEHEKKDAPQRSPSKDSGVSGLSPKARKRASTLNPKAIEFRCTTQEKQSPITSGCDLVTLQSSDTLQNSDALQDSDEVSAPMDPIRRLESRVAELEAQIAQQAVKKSQFARVKEFKTNQVPYGAMGQGFMPPGGGAYHAASNRESPGLAAYQAAHPVPPYPSSTAFTPRAGGAYPAPVPGMSNLGWPQNGTGFPSNGMTAQAATPFQSHVQPAAGTSLWVKSVFGPKPVSKPDRPFHPGDGLQATRQQEYEEYLEHLRMTDPNYALSCRQRQARRADRQRSGRKLLC
ncbi:hypothetical protein F4802DRAFT_504290 [Xylaria palmicola]|nr:hypothetical protein F4802DRAFT_504290 [Xylaria palmicola]